MFNEIDIIKLIMNGLIVIFTILYSVIVLI
jgi:hypothetical protein